MGETCAEINLQSLLTHTSIRLVKCLEGGVQYLVVEENKFLVLNYEWGCNRSQQVH